MSWPIAILFVAAVVTLVLEVSKWSIRTPNRINQAHPMTRTERRRMRRLLQEVPHSYDPPRMTPDEAREYARLVINRVDRTRGI